MKDPRVGNHSADTECDECDRVSVNDRSDIRSDTVDRIVKWEFRGGRVRPFYTVFRIDSHDIRPREAPFVDASGRDPSAAIGLPDGEIPTRCRRHAIAIDPLHRLHDFVPWVDAIPRPFRHGRFPWKESPQGNYFSHCSLSKRGSSLHFEDEAKNDAKRKIVAAMDLPASQEDYPIRPVDQLVLDLLRREEGLSIQDLMERLEVTATAIRQRVDRLEDAGYIERRKLVVGRGRPSYSYYLTDKGWRQAGVSYRDLAIALWSMVQSLDSPESKSKLVNSVAERLGEMYRTELPDASLGLPDASLGDRMRNLAGLLSDRKVPSCLATGPTDLPILEVHACPYPDLVSVPHDRSACHLEQMALSTALGHPVELSQCRLDGHGCCQFTPRAVPGPEAGVTAGPIAASSG